MSHQQAPQQKGAVTSGGIEAAFDAAALADRLQASAEGHGWDFFPRVAPLGPKWEESANKFGDVAQWTELDGPAIPAASKETDVDVRPRGGSSLAKTDTTAVDPSSNLGVSTNHDLLHLLYAVRSYERRCQHLMQHAGRMEGSK